MSFIQGFQVGERLYESANSLVFRAVRNDDGLPVVLKILKNDFPTLGELARYRREFELVSTLDLSGVIRGHELRRHEKTLMMVLEDFGGTSIAQLLKERPLSTDECLEATIQVANALVRVHRSGVIHKDISPGNIVINPGTGEVKLIDFGIASRFSSEHPVLQSPEVLEGTLAYMSPEQTGRMNRSLDYRTDFYSLGATLHEMLTGAPPFQAEDKMEMVHSHLAREPIPAHRRNPDISRSFSKILGKLMAKKAEDRYQSAQGLVGDLEAVRGGVGAERFEPGMHDHSERFQISERLYGRETEVETLLEAFERTKNGNAEMMAVAGYAGVGKSMLINEVHKPITRTRGYFIAGKFDQFQRNDPYSGVLAAFRDLVRQLLTESDASLAAWREDLNEALAPNGQVVLDVLPELELVVGPQAPVPELGPAEAMNRFNRVMGQFLGALSARKRTIVLFLDDLQWADAATLNLLRLALTSHELERFLLIGAYRDNEVDAMHPLSAALQEIRERGGTINNLRLAPLGLTDVAKLLSDTLRGDASDLTALARLVVQKTQGNPLFVKQFLMDLNREGLISPVPAESAGRTRWTWDLDTINAAQITDNVVDLLLHRLKRLSGDTQQALELAACMGNRFDIGTLALIQKRTPAEAFEALRPAVEEELIRPLSALTTSESGDVLSPLVVRDFAFQHDRVQQAAYNLAAGEREKVEIHITIGRRLLDTLSDEVRSERIFEIIDHFNLGRDLIVDPAERMTVASLSLAGARKASDATAYASALSLADFAKDLLGDDGWTENYDLMIDTHRQRGDLEYLNGNFERCAEIVAETLEHARTDLERAEVYFTRILQHTMIAQFGEAVEAGRMALALVGVDLPAADLKEAAERLIGEVTKKIEGRDPASLYDAPEVDSPEVQLAQRCLVHLTVPAFLSDQDLWTIVVGTSVKLSLEHGNVAESALSFANYGLILGAAMSRYQQGYEFGHLALRLCEKYHGRAPVAQVCLVAGSELIPWVEHIGKAIPIIDRGYQDGLDSGDILWAGYLVMYRVILDTFSGKNLDALLDRLPEQLEFTERTRNLGAIAGMQAHQIVASTLAGRTRSSTVFAAGDLEEDAFLRACEENHAAMAICLFNILKSQALYLFGRPTDALEAANEAEGMLAFIVNHPNLADHRLYQSLALAALHTGTDGKDDQARMEKLEANRSQLALWSEGCPENFRAKLLMVEGEIARITGDELAAADRFDRAIDAARDGHYLQDEALANELAARLVLRRRPSSRIVAMYLRDANYAYRLWGANRKVEELELEFPQLATEHRSSRSKFPSSADSLTESIHGSTDTTAAANLDLETLFKAGQTISGEVVVERLHERLLAILTENAGAQRAVLMLVRNGELVIEAEASVLAEEATSFMSIPVESDAGAALVPIGVIHLATRIRDVIVVEDAQHDDRFVGDPYVQARGTRSILCQPILYQGELTGLVYLENDLANAAFTPDRARLVTMLSGQIAISIKNAELIAHLEDKVRERTEQLELHSRFIEQTFGRYMSNEIADRLLKSPDALDFRGRKSTVTVLISDIRGFSTLSDELPPETIVRLLNNYLTEMTDIVQKYNGTIDAFIGDEVVVTFGVPFQRPDDTDRAVACALEMQLAMTRVNDWNVKHGLPEFEIGIGINTGEVVVGNIGSRKRAKYGCVGSNVNIADRIESYTVGGQVLISDSTRDAVRAPLAAQGMGEVEPKGVHKPIRLFEVWAIEGPYGIALQRSALRWTDVEPPIPFRMRQIIDKKVVGDAQDGMLRRLSSSTAQIQTQSTLRPFTDLKITISSDDGVANSTPIYAKVVDRVSSDGLYTLRFTSLPKFLRLYLQERGARVSMS